MWFQVMALYGMPWHLTIWISLSLGPVAQPHSRIWLLTSHRIQIFQTFDRQSKQQWNSTNQWKIHFGNTFYGTNQNNWHPIKLNNQWRDIWLCYGLKRFWQYLGPNIWDKNICPGNALSSLTTSLIFDLRLNLAASSAKLPNSLEPWLSSYSRQSGASITRQSISNDLPSNFQLSSNNFHILSRLEFKIFL